MQNTIRVKFSSTKFFLFFLSTDVMEIHGHRWISLSTPCWHFLFLHTVYFEYMQTENFSRHLNIFIEFAFILHFCCSANENVIRKQTYHGLYIWIGFVEIHQKPRTVYKHTTTIIYTLFFDFRPHSNQLNDI